jgi:hypothetical protein
MMTTRMGHHHPVVGTIALLSITTVIHLEILVHLERDGYLGISSPKR